MDVKKLIGKRLKELRKSKGLTQEKLSEKVGIAPKHLSRIECGVNYPSIDLLKKLADVLDIDLCLIFQTKHLGEKRVLIKEINTLLETQSEARIRVFYKVLLDIIS